MSATAPPPHTDRPAPRASVLNLLSRSGGTVKSAILGGSTKLFLDIIAPNDVLFTGCGALRAMTGKASSDGHLTKKFQPKYMLRGGEDRLSKQDSTEWTVALYGLFHILAHLQCHVCRNTYIRTLEGSVSLERKCQRLVRNINGAPTQQSLALIYCLILACFSPRIKEALHSCDVAFSVQSVRQHTQGSSNSDTRLSSLVEDASVLFLDTSFQELSALRKTLEMEERLLSPSEFIGSLNWINQSKSSTASALEVLFLAPSNEVWNKFDGTVDDPPSSTVDMLWERAALSEGPLTRVALRHLLLQLYEMSCWKKQRLPGNWEFDTLWGSLWIPLLYARAQYRWNKWYANGALTREAPPIREILSPELQIELDSLCKDFGPTYGPRWYRLLAEAPPKLERRLIAWLELVLAELNPHRVTKISSN